MWYYSNENTIEDVKKTLCEHKTVEQVAEINRLLVSEIIRLWVRTSYDVDDIYFEGSDSIRHFETNGYAVNWSETVWTKFQSEIDELGVVQFKEDQAKNYWGEESEIVYDGDMENKYFDILTNLIVGEIENG